VNFGLDHASPQLDAARTYAAFDHLASMVAVIEPSGECLFANTAFEQNMGLARRAVQRSNLFDWFVDPQPVRDTAVAVARNQFSASRLESHLRRPGQTVSTPGQASGEAWPVHVIVSPIELTEHLVVELVLVEQQTRLEREERVLGQVQANKELIRNLAHEIKNPLGGIRGAAQLLEMELPSKGLGDYTRVIIAEADRLQALVDRLLAPHRLPHVVGDVNIHEVCERVRALVLAEFPRGLQVQRDYDVSIPEFRGDREQLIQALLNIAQNAAQALTERIANGDARIVLCSRIARQITLGKQRYRLALELQVVDNGPGVPPELRERIFYPLVTGRDGGSGLGLTLAQTFVQQHLGTVECESQPGKTVFKILIPLP
jgi:two-component system, NtrC family, nitrogen regulation sensor histidine kinase GlnL